MSKKQQNPLIGDSPGMTFERIEGMLELLRSVDYSGRTGVMPENAEIALCDIFGMIQDALRHETSRRKATKGAS